MNFAAFFSGTSEAYIMTLTFKSIYAIYHSDWAHGQVYILFYFIHPSFCRFLVMLP